VPKAPTSGHPSTSLPTRLLLDPCPSDHRDGAPADPMVTQKVQGRVIGGGIRLRVEETWPRAPSAAALVSRHLVPWPVSRCPTLPRIVAVLFLLRRPRFSCLDPSLPLSLAERARSAGV